MNETFSAPAGSAARRNSRTSIAFVAVALAGILVWGLATATREAAAGVKSVGVGSLMDFGDAAGTVDWAGTLVMSTTNVKSATGGVYDFGGASIAASFVIETDLPTQSFSCTLPGSIQISKDANSATVDTFIANPGLSSGMPPGVSKVTIVVGGTVHLAAGQPGADYFGQLTLVCGAHSATADVKLTLSTSIGISNTSALDFGTIVPGATAGSVTITPAGAQSGVAVSLLPGTAGAASFDVTGADGQFYTISLPTSVTLTSGGDTMTLDSFTHDAAVTPKLDAGTDTFNVGGTLHVGGNQASGTYSASFSVTANYN